MGVNIGHFDPKCPKKSHSVRASHKRLAAQRESFGSRRGLENPSLLLGPIQPCSCLAGYDIQSVLDLFTFQCVRGLQETPQTLVKKSVEVIPQGLFGLRRSALIGYFNSVILLGAVGWNANIRSCRTVSLIYEKSLAASCRQTPRMNNDRLSDRFWILQCRHVDFLIAKDHFLIFIDQKELGENRLRVLKRSNIFMMRPVGSFGQPRCNVPDVIRVLNLKPGPWQPFNPGKTSQKATDHCSKRIGIGSLLEGRPENSLRRLCSMP